MEECCLASLNKVSQSAKTKGRVSGRMRKDYIGTLEGHIRERDGVIDEMKSELMSSRTETQDLRCVC